MAVNLQDAFEASMLQTFADRSNHSQGAVARQTDGAAFDHRALGIAMIGAVAGADDPSEFSRVNAGVRIPTTLDHPGIKSA